MEENFAEIEKTLRPKNFKKLQNIKKTRVGLPPQAYFEFTKMLDDDYLTDWEVMKMRLCFRENWNRSFWVPCGIMLTFFLSFNRIMGIKVNRPQMYRNFKFLGSLILSSYTYFMLNSWIMPSKYFHDVLTQPEPNGKYIREALRINMPRHWSIMSKQLYQMGYNFKEMNEYDERIIIPDADNKWDNTYY